MKQLWLTLALLGGLLFSGMALAQQSQDFGNYVVHYNALNTNLIPPQVAQGYAIKRSTPALDKAREERHRERVTRRRERPIEY